MPTNVILGHIDQAMTNVSVAYIQDSSVFIADKVFPRIPVQKKSDVYFIYNKGDLYRDEVQARGMAVESVGGDFGFEASNPYLCKVYAFHKDITDEERANFDNPLSVDRDSTEFITQKLYIKRETDWAKSYFKSGVWTTQRTGVAETPDEDEFLKWSDPQSEPIVDIANEIIKMTGATGFKPNTMVMSPDVFYVLKNHETIIDRIKYTQKGIVTLDLLATLFEVDNIYVPWAVSNTAAKGATDKIGFIMSGSVLLAYVTPRPSLKQPSAGYIFTWTGLEGASAYGNRIVRIPMPTKGLGTERLEGEMAYDHKIICQDMGCFLEEVI